MGCSTPLPPIPWSATRGLPYPSWATASPRKRGDTDFCRPPLRVGRWWAAPRLSPPPVPPRGDSLILTGPPLPAVREVIPIYAIPRPVLADEGQQTTSCPRFLSRRGQHLTSSPPFLCPLMGSKPLLTLPFHPSVGSNSLLALHFLSRRGQQLTSRPPFPSIGGQQTTSRPHFPSIDGQQTTSSHHFSSFRGQQTTSFHHFPSIRGQQLTSHPPFPSIGGQQTTSRPTSSPSMGNKPLPVAAGAVPPVGEGGEEGHRAAAPLFQPAERGDNGFPPFREMPSFPPSSPLCRIGLTAYIFSLRALPLPRHPSSPQ